MRGGGGKSDHTYLYLPFSDGFENFWQKIYGNFARLANISAHLHNVFQFNCFFWERMYIWKLAVMISLFRGYGQIFVGTLLAQLTKYNKERGEIKEELL